MSRLKDRYLKEVVPALTKEFGYRNVMAVPRLEKIVLNMGLGEATQNVKIIDVGADELSRVAGQKAVTTRAKKSIAAFKVRKGMPVGSMVTLRGERAYEFLNKLFNVVLPGIRDFRGLSASAFDGRGNYTIGLSEQLTFPEIEYSEIVKTQGMDITIVTTARDDREGYVLLKALGFPFND